MITDDEATAHRERIEATKRAFLEAIKAARSDGLNISLNVDDRAIRIFNGEEQRATTIDVDVLKPIPKGER